MEVVAREVEAQPVLQAVVHPRMQQYRQCFEMMAYSACEKEGVEVQSHPSWQAEEVAEELEMRTSRPSSAVGVAAQTYLRA